MATKITKTVGLTTTGSDFKTLHDALNWFNSNGYADLVTSDVIAELKIVEYYVSAGTKNGQINLADYFTKGDSTRYVLISVDSSIKHSGTPDGMPNINFPIIIDNGGGTSVPTVKLEDIVFSNSGYVDISKNSTNKIPYVEVNRCIFNNVLNSEVCQLENITTAIVRNTLFYDCGYLQTLDVPTPFESSGDIIRVGFGSTNLYVQNNTIFDSEGANVKGIVISGAPSTNLRIENNAVLDVSGTCIYKIYTGTPSGDNIFTKNVTSDDSGEIPNIDKSVFSNADTGRFGFKKVSNLWKTGNDLSSFFTDDIYGRTRITWGIGAYSFKQYTSKIPSQRAAESIKQIVLIEDSNNKWVDFSDKFLPINNVNTTLNSSMTNFYSKVSDLKVKNANGFWDSPFPAMKTIDGADAVWSSGNYSILQLLNNGKSRIQIIFRHIYGNGQEVDNVLGTYYVDSLKTDLSDVATISVITPQDRLLKTKLDKLKDGDHWYSDVPAWFLMEKIALEVFGQFSSGSKTLPSGFNIPKTAVLKSKNAYRDFYNLGRAPGMLDSDSDGYVDTIAKKIGTPKALLWYKGKLLIGVDNVLWSMDVDTLIYKKIFTVPDAEIFDFDNLSQVTKNVKRHIKSLAYIDLKIIIITYIEEFRLRDQSPYDVIIYDMSDSGYNILPNSFGAVDTQYLRAYPAGEMGVGTYSKEYMVLKNDLLDNSSFDVWPFPFNFNEIDTDPIILPFDQRLRALINDIDSERTYSFGILTAPLPYKYIRPFKLLNSFKKESFLVNNTDDYFMPDTQSVTKNDSDVLLEKGAYFLNIPYSTAQFNDELNCVMYTLGQSGIDRPLIETKNGTSVYKMQWIKKPSTFAVVSEKSRNQFWRWVRTLDYGISIVKHTLSSGTSSVETINKIRTKHPLVPLCVAVIPGTEHVILFLKETPVINMTTYPDNRYTNPNKVTVRSKTYMVLATLDSTGSPLASQESHTLTNDAINNKDKTYWDGIVDTANGLYKESIRFKTTGTVTNAKNKWFKFSNGDSFFAQGASSEDATAIKVNDVGKSIYDYINDTSFHGAVDDFPHVDGDKRNNTITEFARIVKSFNDFDILDIVHVSNNDYAVVFLNNKMINEKNSFLFGVQIFTYNSTSSFGDVVSGDQAPFSNSNVDYKLFLNKPSNLISKNGKVYFTIDGEGHLYEWNGKFNRLGSKSFDLNEYSCMSLTVGESSKDASIFGITAPIPNFRFSDKTKLRGNYSVFSFTKSIYSLVALADFNNMTAADALQRLSYAISHIYGFDNFGNLIVAYKDSDNEENILTIEEGMYKNLLLDYNLKNVYNSVSVSPYKVQVGDVKWNINTLLRSEDYEIKLQLDVQTTTNKKKDVLLLCKSSGYVREFDGDDNLQFIFKKLLGAKAGDSFVIVERTKEEDVLYPTPNYGEIYYTIRTKFSIDPNFSSIDLGILPKRFKYDKKEYTKIDGVEYVKFSSSTDRFVGDSAIPVGIGGFVQYPLFLIKETGVVFEVQVSATINITQTSLQLVSVFGGSDSDNGVQTGYYVKYTNSKGVIEYKNILSVDQTSNIVTIDSPFSDVLYPGTPLQIIPFSPLTNRTNEISLNGATLSGNVLTISDNRLTEHIAIRFYDNDTDTELIDTYIIINTEKDDDGNIVKIYLNSDVSLDKNLSSYSLLYYFTPKIIGEYTKVSNTGIQIKFTTEYPSFPEQRSFSIGESISINLEGSKLVEDQGATVTMSNTNSIKKYGSLVAPKISNKFLNRALASIAAKNFLESYAFPRLKVSVKSTPNVDIPVFKDGELMAIEVVSKKKFKHLPGSSEKFKIQSMVESKKFSDLNLLAVDPYEE